jgi:two-component system, LytTR family, response regulator LytT
LNIRVMIIDDEMLSREELKHLLSQYSMLEIVAEADSGERALEKMIAIQPDVVFLDIEMGELSGLQLAKILQQMKKPPSIVFATAYPNYAAEAFRYEAVDYLLKPFDEQQVGETVERLIRKFAEKTEVKTATRKLAIEANDGIVYVSPADILFCFRKERDTAIVTADKTYYTKLTLKDLEQKLKDGFFFRTHKSYLVNLEKVEQLIPWFNGAYELTLSGSDEKIPVSRNYVKTLRQHLEL